jgi:ubiquinone/menaquinone biosynthesis C-methylase UbiE
MNMLAATSQTYSSIRPAGGDTATPLNLARRLSMIQRCCDVAGKRVIDCGCGAGEYVMALKGLGADAWGVEYDQTKLRSFKSKHAGLSCVCAGDLSQLGFQTATFDLALLNEVLEHVPDDRAALLEIHRVLKDDGTLLLFSPNRLYPFETHGVTLRSTSRRVPHYLPFVPYLPLSVGNRLFSYWARNYWPRELRRLVTGTGFRILSTGYMWQTFEAISGNQPAIITAMAPWLRQAAAVLETVPCVRNLGVSQVIVARKEAGVRAPAPVASGARGTQHSDYSVAAAQR